MAAAPPAATAQATLAWDQVKYYQYNILDVSYVAGTRTATIVFSVTNPMAGHAPYDILGPTAAAVFLPPASLRVDVSWNAGNWGTTELVNTKDGPFSPILRTISGGIVSGPAPASVVAINALTTAKRCDALGSPLSCPPFPNANLTYWVTQALPAAAAGAGRVGIEGHPSTPLGVSIPVKSVHQDFSISGAAARRQVVDIGKCKVCHDNGRHGDALMVPRLSLHGANRNEETQVCVMCHNPNQTDAAYRTSGAEESVDFKRMIHGIHAGGFREKPLIIIGRNGSVNDFSHIRFPAELKNCLNCHIEVDRRGTFELPLTTTLGSTIATGSVLNVVPGQIDIDPSNDLKISPIAAACSSCHDKAEVRQHMIQKGALFGVVQAVLDQRREQCATCHGPGRERDVRRVHEVGSSSRRDD